MHYDINFKIQLKKMKSGGGLNEASKVNRDQPGRASQAILNN